MCYTTYVNIVFEAIELNIQPPVEVLASHRYYVYTEPDFQSPILVIGSIKNFVANIWYLGYTLE